jgi:hypothetical protein
MPVVRGNHASNVNRARNGTLARIAVEEAVQWARERQRHAALIASGRWWRLPRRAGIRMHLCTIGGESFYIFYEYTRSRWGVKSVKDGWTHTATTVAELAAFIGTLRRLAGQATKPVPAPSHTPPTPDGLAAAIRATVAAQTAWRDKVHLPAPYETFLMDTNSEMDIVLYGDGARPVRVGNLTFKEPVDCDVARRLAPFFEVRRTPPGAARRAAR